MARKASGRQGSAISDTQKMILTEKAVRAQRAALDPYRDCLAGDDFAIVVAICADEAANPAPMAERSDIDALRKALEAMGYLPDSLALVDLAARRLSPGELRILIEQIDPVAIVALDSMASAELYASFGSAVRDCVDIREGVKVLMGRKVVSIDGFSASLDDPESKREAWQRLKELAHWRSR
ncbi:MAG: hypothetical protein K6G78_04505 [bacterium]|nr:hypothetical protein [bacterium]